MTDKDLALARAPRDSGEGRVRDCDNWPRGESSAGGELVDSYHLPSVDAFSRCKREY